MLGFEETDIDYVDRIDDSVLAPDPDLDPPHWPSTSQSDAQRGTDGRRSHEVTIWFPPGEAAGNETKYELECNLCGVIGAVRGRELADVLARLHEKFVSVLVDLREAGERA